MKFLWREILFKKTQMNKIIKNGYIGKFLGYTYDDIKSLKIKPLIAFAVVRKKRPKININEIFADEAIVITKDEKIIKVKIEVIE